MPKSLLRCFEAYAEVQGPSWQRSRDLGKATRLTDAELRLRSQLRALGGRGPLQSAQGYPQVLAWKVVPQLRAQSCDMKKLGTGALLRHDEFWRPCLLKVYPVLRLEVVGVL